MKECIGHIELTHRPALRSSDGEHGANCSGFDHRRDGFAEVHTGTLCKPPNNPACLVSIERSIRFEFMGEHPLAQDDMSTSRAINKLPGTGSLESVESLFHGRMLVGIVESGIGDGNGEIMPATLVMMARA